MIETINHFHLFCGSGSGAAGFNDARPEIPGLKGRMVCLGGMDVDPVGAEDFRMLAGVPCTVRDIVEQPGASQPRRSGGACSHGRILMLLSWGCFLGSGHEF